MKDIDWKFLFTDFEGRINRQLFWIGVACLLAAHVLNGVLFGRNGLVPIVIAGLIVLAGLAVYVKRCHDRDKSGWWCLLLAVPVVGFVWWIVDLGILEGTRGENRFGPDPLEHST